MAPASGDPNQGSLCVAVDINSALWFHYDSVSGQYVATYSTKTSLQRNAVQKTFSWTDLSGRQTVFYDFSNSQPAELKGQFKSFVDPYGNATDAEYDSQHRLIRYDQSGPGGTSATYEYAYLTSGDNAGRLASVTYLLNSANVRRVLFEYYDSGDSSSSSSSSSSSGTVHPYGSLGDLKLVTVQQYSSSAWADLNHSYYRYYVFGDTLGFVHGLKYEVGPEAYARMVAAGLTPVSATDAQVALYADKYFEYDFDRRVTLESVHGGAQTFTYARTESSFTDDYNHWNVKAVETRPDGSVKTVFTNYLGSVILTVLQSGSSQWFEFSRYDVNGRLVLSADSAAVTGYDEAKPDLLGYDAGTGLFEYLSNDSGLLRLSEYYASTDPTTGAAQGYLSNEKIKQGQLGTEIKLRALTYAQQSAGGTTIYPTKTETVYRSDSGGGSDPVTTTSDYVWFPGTVQVQQQTTTWPVVPTSQNGSGVAASRVVVSNEFGLQTWRKDERGFITHFVYDTITNALVQRIDDVNTSIVSGAPAGWVTPTGGGLNLVTDYTNDSLGRVVEELGPVHTVDLSGTATAIRRATWHVYQDETYEQWVGQGYQAAGADTLINPVSITQMDSAGRVVDQISATRASTAGKLLPTDTFPQTSWVRWNSNDYDDQSNLDFSRAYHLIPPSGDGTSGTNYDQTDYGYDAMDRQNRVKTPGGTITRTVYDMRGLVAERWVGTDDTGATDSNPAGSGAPNNMVKVQSNVYDNGLAGGDGNLTAQTAYVDDASTRVTQYTYDFRNRRTAEQGEVDYYAAYTYDNLDRTIKTERRNTNASGNLIAKNETNYDNRGRVYQTVAYGVNPSTGAVGNALTSNTWFDDVGNVIKQLPAGSGLFQKSEYDGLNRMTVQYSAYDTGESSYADAGSVADDTVMQQMENMYDAASNLIQLVSRQRFHDATGTGPLMDPNGAQPKARVSYAASYPDPLGRTIASANYGTNGALAFTRPDTIPARSDTVLVNSTAYDDRGEAWQTVDPQGTVNQKEFDDAGRMTQQVENYVSGGTAADQNRTTEYGYNTDGKLVTLTVKNNVTGDQVTTWIYGTTLSDSDIASNELLRAKEYPDGSSDRVEYSYNRLGQTRRTNDQRGCVRVLEYDKLGRLLNDRVTTPGSGVDTAVLRVSRAYEVRGMVTSVTSYDNATVGSGSVVNEVKSEYNDFSQLVNEYQSHAGAVDTSTTPRMQYAYADGSTNTIRRTSQTYPDGRVTTYDYGTSGGMSDVLSRVESLKQSASLLAGYTYLGLGEMVRVEYGS
ncbi:MAG: hypothetical protein EBS84_19395 [Proteobacteria bacterium]|nr:hypothetical protein [Verrucomicrobiota bacterium]NBU11152.1 hypothetical protein [Pseudomonadota bacterium]